MKSTKHDPERASLFPDKPNKKEPCMVNMSDIPHHVHTVVSEEVESNRNEDSSLRYRNPQVSNIFSFKEHQFDNSRPKKYVQVRKQMLEKKVGVMNEKEFRRSQFHSNDDGNAPLVIKEKKLVKNDTIRVISDKSRSLEHPKKRSLKTESCSEQAPGGAEKVDRSLTTDKSSQLFAATNHNEYYKDPINNGDVRQLSEEEEEWEKMRIQTLKNYDINMTGKCSKKGNIKNGGGTSSLSFEGGINFSDITGREAPICFQPPKYQSGDLFYNPKYSQTTKEVKKYADVRIDKYASRPHKTTLITDRLNKLLTIEYLTKLHKKGLQRDLESVFRTPDDSSHIQHYDICYDKKTKVYRPLEPFDDSSLHPAAPLKLTLTRKYGHTPDLSKYADREETLEAIFGTEMSMYKQRAKEQLKNEGFL